MRLTRVVLDSSFVAPTYYRMMSDRVDVRDLALPLSRL